MDNNKNKRPNFEIDYNDFKNSADIQKFINRQLWVAGGSVLTDTANVVNQTVKWGGQSRFLCGFNFFMNNPQAHIITITLNQEKIIDSVPISALFPSGAFGNIKFQQYFEFIRPLSGSDVMIFSLTSTIAESISYGIYMTRAYNRYYTRD
jgi:hypothetical protein